MLPHPATVAPPTHQRHTVESHGTAGHRPRG
jgi:hypothetical protein